MKLRLIFSITGPSRLEPKVRVFGTALVTGVLLLASCSINKLAMKSVSDALTGPGGTDVFTGDSDPQLVGDALPFAIKLYETLLAQNPDHQGLLLTTGSLFVMYANAFVQGPAEMEPPARAAERQAGKARAKSLYLRGADLLYRGLERRYPGFSGAFKAGNLDAYLSEMKKEDVPFLYWGGAGILAAYSLDNFDLNLGVRVPEVGAMMNRAYALDPDFNNGAIDDFFILFYASLPPTIGGDKARAEAHFQRAVEKTGGLAAGPYVSYAVSVAVPAQDYNTFKEKLEAALAVDPEGDPANRLVNLISQKKARYYLDNAADYFLELDSGNWEWEAYEE
jgi:predicted anti-sigma-YlaC factor YlaD